MSTWTTNIVIWIIFFDATEHLFDESIYVENFPWRAHPFAVWQTERPRCVLRQALENQRWVQHSLQETECFLQMSQVSPNFISSTLNSHDKVVDFMIRNQLPKHLKGVMHSSNCERCFHDSLQWLFHCCRGRSGSYSRPCLWTEDRFCYHENRGMFLEAIYTQRKYNWRVYFRDYVLQYLPKEGEDRWLRVDEDYTY